MSVVYGRFAFRVLSSFPFRNSFLRRRGLTHLLYFTSGAAPADSAKPTARAATLSPGNNSLSPTPFSPNLSVSSVESLTAHQKDQISLYVRTLLQWNEKMNLTAVTEESEVMTRHVEDSLAILPPLQRSYLSHCAKSTSLEGLNVVDVGSGAGLPGMILAIACPSWKFTLLESMKKRCYFLEHIVTLIGLSNVQILCERAESVGQCADFRELFDVAVARAVAEMRILAEYCLPLVRVGGLFVAAKGADPQEEVKRAENSIQLLGASILELCTVESHSPKGQRTSVICVKDRATPRKYPRQAGTPAKLPL
ncbi:ribosomal RNA small subunit methyltransferase G-like [Zingiber officinale]|uniref:ribosomal RNA small subunit methyltransferase G-like n=1 Tax=Zingiber officinale TaxID=94328 RepID=UPI001C4CEA74|nr:ribosomal RNA small subunit methyltransferase G-like [Zingiber officinale]XP_042374350.1 ribosomal RNA small subunit methyltransferase G-like [Zingiber officinale]XP_042451639.1 ribosomal RNA small subunit methyltransferase G-like [Zingiber officinale]XP_042451640.1 ribosomal RNA small subunit methyltransferase G-like [Zingiber officinale]